MTDINVLSATNIVIFGATGDLAKRKLFPAFYNLFIDGRMPENFNIIALGRSDHNDEYFRNYIKVNLEAFSRKNVTPEHWEAFQSHITYFQHQLDEENSYKNLNRKLLEFDSGFGVRGNRLFYLSIGPILFLPFPIISRMHH